MALWKSLNVAAYLVFFVKSRNVKFSRYHSFLQVWKNKYNQIIQGNWKDNDVGYPKNSQKLQVIPIENPYPNISDRQFRGSSKSKLPDYNGEDSGVNTGPT